MQRQFAKNIRKVIISIKSNNPDNVTAPISKNWLSIYENFLMREPMMVKMMIKMTTNNLIAFVVN